MGDTPREVLDAVVHAVCDAEINELVRLSGGGRNEAFRANLSGDASVVVRIARQSTRWFVHEKPIMAMARDVGIPTPDVLGAEHIDHEGELLSFSILEVVDGRALDELVDELTTADIERLIMESGEMLAKLHGLVIDRGEGRELKAPTETFVSQVVRTADEVLGPEAATIVERGAVRLARDVNGRGAPKLCLSHGDWLPKHLMIADGKIVGVIDWEFAGPASPAFDLAHWEVAAGAGLHERSDLLRAGYARVADPDLADEGWVPAFAIDFCLEILGWQNPASKQRLERCIEVIATHTRVG